MTDDYKVSDTLNRCTDCDRLYNSSVNDHCPKCAAKETNH